MIKRELTIAIASKTGIDRESVQVIIDRFIEEVPRALSNGKSVHLRGFGSFISKKRASKPARNIKKNTTIIIPERYVPHFKPSAYLVNKVLNGAKKCKNYS